MKKLTTLAVLVILVLPVAAGCVQGGSQSASPTPTDTPVSPMPTAPPSEHRCGDRVCDGPENPQSCPEDCAPVVTPSPDDGEGDQPEPPPGGPGEPETTPTPGGAPGGPAATPPPDEEPQPPSAGETDWEGNVDFTCEVVGGKQYFWRAYIDLEFTVAPDGTINGSGWGEFTENWITMPECVCEFSVLGPISAEVSGYREGDFFHLSVMPAAEMVERCVCQGHTVEVPLMQLLACLSVPGGPTDFTIEARDNALVEWNGTQEGGGGSITGTGVSAVYPK
jgi:hypothetical protein